MSVSVRDVRDPDVPWCVDLLVAWDPMIPADMYRRAVTGEAGPLLANRIAELDGQPVGLASVIAFPTMPHPMCSVVVAAGHRARGIGSVLFADVWPTLPDACAVAGMPDGDERSLAIAGHWGFEVVGHGVESTVDLTTGIVAPDLPAGVSVVAAAATTVDADDADSFLARVGDYPEAEEYGMTVSNAAFLRMAPECLWLQLRDERGILAATVLDPRPDGEWYVVFTGSDPRARGRGLARVAKQLAHAYARDHGAERLRTTNEARNERIRALNASLGYRRVGGDVRLVRRSGATGT